MLGRWLGVCRNDAATRTYFVLTISGSVIPRSDVIPLTKEERENPKWIDRIKHLDETLKKKTADDKLPKDEADMMAYFQGKEKVSPTPDALDPVENFYSEDISMPFDQQIGQYVRVPFDEQTAVVKILNKRMKFDGNLKGGTEVYTARLPDGSEREYTKDMVAENLYAQCDSDGNMVRLIDEILDHASDNSATKISDGQYFDEKTKSYKQ